MKISIKSDISDTLKLVEALKVFFPGHKFQVPAMNDNVINCYYGPVMLRLLLDKSVNSIEIKSDINPLNPFVIGGSLGVAALLGFGSYAVFGKNIGIAVGMGGFFAFYFFVKKMKNKEIESAAAELGDFLKKY